VIHILLLTLIASTLSAETIAEKKAKNLWSKDASLPKNSIQTINQEISDLRKELDKSYQTAQLLQERGASDEEFAGLLVEMNRIKEAILQTEERWKDRSSADAKKEEEGYGLWDQEETTLSQLITEYGAMDFLYIIPPEIAALKLNLHSTVPIPRESWRDLLELLLNQNGIGIKQLGPYTRQLFIFKQDLSAVQKIATTREGLQLIPAQTRLFYLFSPAVEQIRSSLQFFERFSDAKQTFVHQIGNKIALISSKEEIERMLSLYQAIWGERNGKVSRVVPISKMHVKEMEKILTTFFGEAIEKNRPPFGKQETEGLSLFSLPQGNAIVLIGSQAVVDRAEKIVQETESQLQDPAEMTVFLYHCLHSDPADLGKVLGKVYNSLLFTATEAPREMEINYTTQSVPQRTPDGYAAPPPLVVAPPILNPGTHSRLEVDEGIDHFIPDPKTGTLLMVVRRDTLIRIKDLLRKLDVPKKMVQIEVLLFEKRLHDQNNFGLNLLKLGSDSSHMIYRAANLTPAEKPGLGVLQFLLQMGKSKHFPAFDLAYQFLMTQEDIQLNAAPSIVTINQTPATIKIVEEQSINNGAAPIDTNKGTAFEKSFSRAQYGITIVVTPTIHLSDSEEFADGRGFVTLQTNITFDTTKSNHDDRPTVDRRNIENEVRVADGQTVILGGLRRRATHDNEEKIPFLGELPGIGKLFGSTKLSDSSTEMFFFITPKIILDPEQDLECAKIEMLKKRAGDIPEYLDQLIEAYDKEKRQFFRGSCRLLGVSR